MEHSKLEVAVIQEMVSDVAEAQVQELSDLQLAFIGGGICDTIPH